MLFKLFIWLSDCRLSVIFLYADLTEKLFAGLTDNRTHIFPGAYYLVFHTIAILKHKPSPHFLPGLFEVITWGLISDDNIIDSFCINRATIEPAPLLTSIRFPPLTFRGRIFMVCSVNLNFRSKKKTPDRKTYEPFLIITSARLCELTQSGVFLPEHCGKMNQICPTDITFCSPAWNKHWSQ